MSTGRKDRIIFGSCIPPLLGGLIYYVYISIVIETTPSYFSPEYNESPITHFFGGLFFVPFISIGFLILFGLQSFFYSLIMEFWVQKINNDILAVFISMIISALILNFNGFHAQIMGGIVGLIVGIYLRKKIKLKPANKQIN
jgi:hypothetical protein